MGTTQPALFGPAAANSSGLRNSVFAGNRELPVYRWVPWVAGFSAHFIDDCLSQYLPAAGRADSWVPAAVIVLGRNRLRRDRRTCRS